MNSNVDVKRQLGKVLSVGEGKTKEFLQEYFKLEDLCPSCYDMVISALEEKIGEGDSHVKIKVLEILNIVKNGLTGEYVEKMVDLKSMDLSSFKILASGLRHRDGERGDEGRKR